MIIYPRYWFSAGFTPLPNLMIIRKDCQHSVPLHKHEETHQEQMRRDGVLKFWFRYLFSKKHRLNYEVEAYKVQISHGASLDGCAKNLSIMYYLGISFETAKNLLSD